MPMNAKRCFQTLLFSLSLLFTSYSVAQPWQHDVSTDVDGFPLDVYTRQLTTSDIKAFKSETVIPAKMQSILAVLLNIDDYPRLLHNSKQSKLVLEDDTPYVYTQIKGFWPVKPRDVIFSANITQSDDYSIHISGYDVTGILPSDEDHQRMFNAETYWQLTPINKTQTRVYFYSHADPGGIVPQWLVNLNLTDIPEYTLTNLHALVKEPQYRDATIESMQQEAVDLSFIKLPQ